MEYVCYGTMGCYWHGQYPVEYKNGEKHCPCCGNNAYKDEYTEKYNRENNIKTN
jgi:hypothetical protein